MPTLRRPSTALAALLLAVLPTVAACGSSPATLRMADVEDAIVRGFADQVGGQFAAACPTSAPAEAGFTFTCTVTDVDAGATVLVDVVEDDADGSFRWHATGVTDAAVASSSPAPEPTLADS